MAVEDILADVAEVEISLDDVPHNMMSFAYPVARYIQALFAHARAQNGTVKDIKNGIDTVHRRIDKLYIVIAVAAFGIIAQLLMFIYALFGKRIFG